MLRVSTAEGWRSLDPESITKVFRFGGDGRYSHCVIVLRDCEEVSGAVADAALDTIEAKLDTEPLPPLAA